MFGKTRRERSLHERNAREAQARFDRNERVAITVTAITVTVHETPTAVECTVTVIR
jgi:hypothetical protein